MVSIPKKQDILLKNIKKDMSSLEEILKEVNSHWASEDLIYRYYHGSFKVYRIQFLTQKLCSALERISPHDGKKTFNSQFSKIISEGASGISWKLKHNREWDKICRPFLEAFFHSRYFLEMAIKYGKKYDAAPTIIDAGWAALLELYNTR